MVVPEAFVLAGCFQDDGLGLLAYWDASISAFSRDFCHQLRSPRYIKRPQCIRRTIISIVLRVTVTYRPSGVGGFCDALQHYSIDFDSSRRGLFSVLFMITHQETHGYHHGNKLVPVPLANQIH